MTTGDTAPGNTTLTADEANAPVIAMLAGEDSGDQLGADLIAALRQRYPAARFVGIGGARMRAQGFEAWHDVAVLSVMGFAEVLRHLPRLLRLRRELVARLLALRPDVLIGIDAPDFNLGVEKRLKRAGIRTVHYVSPSIWAWREKRAQKIGTSADRVLCLFPMEPAIYARHGVDARFVGHPLANRFALVAERGGARDALSLPHDVPVLAVLPGSRPSEVGRLGKPFLDAAQRVAAAIPGLRVVVPVANQACRDALQLAMAAGAGQVGTAAPPMILEGHAHDAMLAADVVLLASGTAALEAMLAKRPMVVGYKVAPLSYRIARLLKMLKTDVYSLPNILAGRRVVPELMQDDCTAERLADAVLALFSDSGRRGDMVATFERLHVELQGGLDASAAAHAADAVAELIGSP